MSDRIDLSAHTWIEGGRIHTTSEEVSCAWDLNDIEIDPGVDECSASLTDVAPVYEYRKNEAWLFIDCFGFVSLGDSESAHLPDTPDAIWLQRRAAAVCDGAEQFRALHAALKEARR